MVQSRTWVKGKMVALDILHRWGGEKLVALAQSPTWVKGKMVALDILHRWGGKKLVALAQSPTWVKGKMVALNLFHQVGGDELPAFPPGSGIGRPGTAGNSARGVPAARISKTIWHNPVKICYDLPV
jgi:hypothetical protein